MHNTVPFQTRYLGTGHSVTGVEPVQRKDRAVLQVPEEEDGGKVVCVCA